MNYTTIRQTVEGAFNTGWGTTTPIAWENAPAILTNSEWVRLSVITTFASNSSLGDRRTLKSGIIVIQIFTPLDQGAGRAYELADLANTILENKRWSDLFTYAGAAELIGESPSTHTLGTSYTTSTPGFYQLNLKVPFEANS